MWRTGIAVLVLAAPALAEAPPVAAPDAGYRVVMENAGGLMEIDVRRQGPLWRQEMISDGETVVVHYDAGAGIATVIEPGQAYRMRIALADVGLADPEVYMERVSDTEVEWTRGGTRQIAGVNCTDYTARGSRDGTERIGEFCVTPEGVLLRIATRGMGPFDQIIEARAVEIGPQPAEIFDTSAWAALPIEELGE